MSKAIFWMTILASALTSACQPAPAVFTPVPGSATPAPAIVFPTALPESAVPTQTPQPYVPNFKHIAIVVFENREYESVIGNRAMPYFNLLANSFTLLNQHYATTHPSLPNYLSLIGGDTFGITDDCDSVDCSVNAPSLPDLIEASGRTWKTYQDDMPETCYFSDTIRYVRKHNPFVFFEPIRLDRERCNNHVVPLNQLDIDIDANILPSFIFITPDICYSGHDCALELADGWLKEIVEKLYPPMEAAGEPYLIIITWDEGQSSLSCCGLPEKAGGRVATILISPQVKSTYVDSTPYSHYSILKTISQAWNLPYLGHAADAETNSIVEPWK